MSAHQEMKGGRRLDYLTCRRRIVLMGDIDDGPRLCRSLIVSAEVLQPNDGCLTAKFINAAGAFPCPIDITIEPRESSSAKPDSGRAAGLPHTFASGSSTCKAVDPGTNTDLRT